MTKAATTRHETLPVTLSVNDTVHELSFVTPQASYKAEGWMQTGEHLTFDFQPPVSGYLVEFGNTSNFAMPQPYSAVPLSGVEIADITFSVNRHDLSKASVALFCLVCDEDANIIAKHRINFSGGAGRDLFNTPPQAAHLSFALRMEGTGSFSGLSIRVMLTAGKSKGKTGVAALTPASSNASMLAKEMMACVAARNLSKCIALYHAADTKGDAELRQLIRAYATLHDFENVIETFLQATEKVQAEPGMRLYYMRALANTSRISEIQDFILQATLAYKGDTKDVEFMMLAYPFSVYLSDTLADAVMARILSFNGVWPKKRLPYMMRCAHDLVTAKRFRDFYHMYAVIETQEMTVADRAKLDLLDAQAAYVAGSYTSQLQYLNKALAKSRAYPLETSDPTQPLDFRYLTCAQNVAGTVRGPLVTILMTCFNSADTIEYAIRSLLAQSYRDIEVIVINDCSTDHSASIVRQICTEDTRVQIIELSKNSGTYVATNMGLQQAKGEYVTRQDSDDWAHPEKIERIVHALQNHPDIIGAALQHVRYDPKRGFRGLGGYIRPDASSLMYRRKKVLDAIGYYDSVRRRRRFRIPVPA